jgi:hypothetical protein
MGEAAVARKAAQVVRLVTSIALAALRQAHINRVARVPEISGASYALCLYAPSRAR